MPIHDWFFQQTSQALGFLSMIGVVAAAVRWRTAVRRDILLSFAVYLLGASLREVVVYYYAGTSWTELAYLTSGIARVIQLAGVVMFLRSALHEHCPPWALWTLFAFVFLLVGVA